MCTLLVGITLMAVIMWQIVVNRRQAKRIRAEQQLRARTGWTADSIESWYSAHGIDRKEERSVDG